jgi:molybdate transport system substrate-binding protein
VCVFNPEIDPMRLIQNLLFKAPALLCLVFATTVQAAEVRVFVAGAAKAAYEMLAPDYQRATGNTLRAEFDTVGALRDRVLAGAPVDVVMLSSAAVDALAQKGFVAAPMRSDVGIVVAGLAVKRGAPVPDISTEAALRQTLLSATTISHADGARGATSGLHFSKVIDAMGLREALAPRITVLPFGVDVIHGVANGTYALGVSQSSEIVPLPDVTFVGGLPAPYSLRTVYSVAAVGSSEAGQQLLRFMQSDAARAKFAAAGFAQP